jgi:hypothetical protein
VRRIQFEELERRRLLYTVTSDGDEPLYPGMRPAETILGTVTLRSAIQQINRDGGGEIDFADGLGPIDQSNNALEPDVEVPAIINGGSVGRVALFLQLVLTGNDITVENIVVSGAVAADQIVVTGNHDLIENDSLGTDFYNPEESGEGAYPEGGYGVLIEGSNNTVRSCVISGNAISGVAIDGGSNNLIVSNHIGTDFAGTKAIPNGYGGVEIFGGAFNNTIGGTSSTLGNLISGNASPATAHYSGVDIVGAGTTRNVVEGNFIGTDITGTVALANANAGVTIAGGATDNTIGGTANGLGNLISGNGGPLASYPGVAITGAGTTGNVLAGNLIGTDITGNHPLGNAGGGVVISNGASNNAIGGTVGLSRNHISGNLRNGIEITGTGTSNNVVAGNDIGTNFNGTAAIPNGTPGSTSPNTGCGILIDSGATNNSIGGAVLDSTNLVSGNAQNGIGIDGNGTSGNVVQGNSIGTNLNETAAIPNGTIGSTIGSGIVISAGANHNTIGGAGLLSGNLISGNLSNGVEITGASSSNNVVAGNDIGTDVAGTAAIPNGTPGSVSSSTGCGVLIDSGAADNTIGGSLGVTVTGNVISGNAADGVLVTGSHTMRNVVEGNYIGTDANFVQTDTTTGAVYGAPGPVGIGNGGDGVHIADFSFDNMIGGTDGAGDPVSAMDGNIIAFNAMNGVAVDSGTGNTIREDLFIDNGGSAFTPGPAPNPPYLPISLGDNATQLNPNSSMAQHGANNLENYPIVTVSYNTPNKVQVFNQSETDVTVEVYCLTQEVEPDGTLVDAGAQLLDVEVVGANGTAQFEQPTLSAHLVQTNAGNDFTERIVGTSTDPNGNTSEFGVALTPAQVRTAYGINYLPYDGTGQTIAIVSQGNDPNLLTDLDNFDQQFGVNNTGPTLFQQYGPASSFVTFFNQGGAPDAGDIGEEVLDVEWAHAIAPAAHIDVVEGTDVAASVPIAATLPGVSVVSESFGGDEFDEEQQDDPTYIAPGVVFLGATGDHGIFDAGYPAFSPYVVAVGGTTLTLNGDGTYSSEAGWGSGADSARPNGGSGGGQSLFEAEPRYQLDVQTTGFRTIPDVSIIGGTDVAIADSYNQQSGNPGWGGATGTSLSTPVWAGLIALVDQGRADAGRAAFNSNNPEQIQQALYSLPATDFHSPAVLDGDNGTTDDGLLDPDRYDEVTGLGSPIANLLVPDLINYNPAPAPAPTVRLSAVSGEGVYRGTGTLTATVTLNDSSLSGVTVTFKLTNGTTVTAVGSATTDANGVATLSGVSMTGFAVGDYPSAVAASVASTPTYNGSSAVGDLTVTPAKGTFDVISTADDGSAGTLRWAIAQANSATTPSTIDFGFGSSSETITLTQGEIELKNTAAAITIDGPGAALLSISGGYASRVFAIDKGVVASLSGVTITEGVAQGSHARFYGPPGGGLYNEGSVTISGCTLSDNSAHEGGGLFNTGTADLSDCVVSGNGSYVGGGLNSYYGTLKLTNCMVTGNSSVQRGGGVYAVGGTLSLADCTITDNYNYTISLGGLVGGGLFIGQLSQAVLTSCTVSRNAGIEGGGLFNSSGSALSLVDCTVSGNTALEGISSQPFGAYGGGLYNDGVAEITDSTISGNTALQRGGGVYNKGKATITSSTISGNQAGYSGGGLYNFGGKYYHCTAVLYDAIVAGNTNKAQSASDIGGNGESAVTGSYNLSGTGGSGGLTAAHNNLIDVADPGLSPLADNGGPTETMALLPGSPAIGAGTTIAGVTTDQRGEPLDSPPDIGAYQTQGSHGSGLAFAGLASPSVSYGTASVTLSGTLASGNLAPPNGESVEITLSGVTQHITLGAGGAFSTAFEVSTLGVSGSPYTITYSYAGDQTYSPARAMGFLTVTQATPKLDLTARGGSFDGRPHAASVTIAGSGADSSPAASLEGVSPELTYYLGSSTSGTNLGSTPPLVPGSYSVIASFPGSTDYAAVESAPVNFTISNGSANLALTSSHDSAVYGQPVTFVATVTGTGPTPAGTVTFFSGSTPMGAVTLHGSNTATLTISSLAPGSHSISASYSGGDFLNAPPLSESIAKASTRVELIPRGVHPGKKAASIELTAEILPVAPGAGTPTGVVTFMSGKSRLGSKTLRSGLAVFTFNLRSVPNQAVTVVYSGDRDFRSAALALPKPTRSWLSSLTHPIFALFRRASGFHL